MTKTELRELYGEKCVYCKIDEETEKELSDLELKEIFEPTINKMIADGYTYEQLEEFIILCHSCCFMSDKTYANAYNGTPFSTQFEAEYRNGWKITAIERCEAKRNGKKHKYDILAISSEAREKIVENAIKNINW